MTEKYIQQQRKIIKKLVKKFLPGYLLVIFLVLLVVGSILYVMPPHPQSWQTDEIEFVDAQYRNKKRTLARYASSGYELIDQNGNFYWAEKELTWQELGETYTIKYYIQEGYRSLVSVSCGDTVIISEKGKIEAWEQSTAELGMLLLICAGIMIWVLWSLYKAFQHPEIQECRKRIRMYEAKTARRALEKRRK